MKVLEKVAAAHWMECQPEVQNLLVAPMDNEEETRVHQTWNNRRIRYQATASHVIQQKSQHLLFFSVETPFLESYHRVFRDFYNKVKESYLLLFYFLIQIIFE